MATQPTHHDRETMVLADLKANFPNFAARHLVCANVAEGQDPPDFIAHDGNEVIGLELVELLDGGQMGPAKARERQRSEVRRILTRDWETEYQPRNFRGSFPSLIPGLRIARPEHTCGQTNVSCDCCHG